MVGRRYDGSVEPDEAAHAGTPPAAEPLDQRPLGVGIGIALLVMVVGLPWLLVPLWWLVANGIALATGSDFSSDTVSVPALVVGIVGVVTVLALGTALVIGLAGRGLSPRRRRSA